MYFNLKINLQGLSYVVNSRKGLLKKIALSSFYILLCLPMYAQITLKSPAASLESILFKIRNQSGHDLFYDANEIKDIKVAVDLKNATLEEALRLVFQGQAFTYRIENKTILIQAAKVPAPSKQENYINGRVIDQNGEALAGVSIRLKTDRTKVVSSDRQGYFSLPLSADGEIITLSLIGYSSKESKANRHQKLALIELRSEEQSIDDVVVTGMMERKKESFTGASTSFSGNQLREVGNSNVIQTLKSLDPSFLMLDNNLAGANPNALPQIEIRGKTSVPGQNLSDVFGMDPNQPVFILNGFETNLQTIVDLDINRILSVSILKDAASTAIYGARASNGVVVIETIKPKAGPLRVSFNNDNSFEFPDLSAYNMMNAKEKLEYEVLAGRYRNASVGNSPFVQLELDELYNKNLRRVQQGVDSYWLKEPVRTGISNNSSLYVDGGADAFSYTVGFNYKIQNGVMKGSDRDTWGGNVTLNYRKDKITFENTTFVKGFQSNESPFGQFSSWVNTNPYYEKTNERYLENTKTAEFAGILVNNPLFDANLNSYNKNNNMEIQNNLRLGYKINNQLNWSTALQLLKGYSINEKFVDPASNDFINSNQLRKGRYDNRRSDNFSYNFNSMLSYSQKFATDHEVTANFRVEANERKNESIALSAEGFPEGNMGNPKFAYSYLNNGTPSSNRSVYRTINSLITTNYAFKSKYMMDLSYRIDGSTAFGSSKQYSPFWSAGLGWNAHREEFLKDQTWITRIKLIANVGMTGNQNYGSISSQSIYDYNTNAYFNQFGQGLTLSGLGNPDLIAQSTKQYNIGTDFALFNNRFSGWINFYLKNTDPLVVPLDLPSSTGIYSYPINVGALHTKGWDARLEYSLIQRPEKQTIWKINLTVAHYKDKYKNFDNKLASLNKEQELNKSLLRYHDGYSPSSIWAAKSEGIDPGTGREIFVSEEGLYTFDYNEAEVLAVGNSQPVAEGVFSTSFFLKGFNFGAYFRFRLGADIFNAALFDKVENISYTSIINNQDKRALYDRWKNPGDISSFVAISQTAITPASSRFVQQENSFSGESINFGYTFSKQEWLRSLGVKSLNVTAYMNEFFRVSSVLRERGIHYPFARSGSISVRASF